MEDEKALLGLLRLSLALISFSDFDLADQIVR